MIHISLGPTCLPAHILKTCGLRNASYPLDWAHSGSTHFSDLLKLEPVEFYWAHVHKPSIQFVQQDDPALRRDCTSLLKPRPSIYGYEYFYNPHRVLGSNMGYHMRTICRFKDALSGGVERLSFLLADYVSKPGGIFFDNPLAQLRFIDESLQEACRSRFNIVMLRVAFLGRSQRVVSHKVERLSATASVLSIALPQVLDDTYNTESDFLSLILGKIYLRFSMNNE